MKLPENLRKQVAFVAGPEERSEPPCGILVMPYKALNNATFNFWGAYPFFKVYEWMWIAYGLKQ